MALGRRGEALAAGYLEQSGHTILATNWRWSHFEIDIISQDNLGLHFVEVKSRRISEIEPVENFTAKKRSRLVKAANAFLNGSARKNLTGDFEVFFDLITIVFDDNGADIKYFPQVFIPIST